MRLLDTTAMRCLRALAPLRFGLSLLSACILDDDSPSSETVKFETAQKVSTPAVLTGDPTSGRCADPSQPCFDGKSDFLNGQRKMLRVDDIAIFTQTPSNNPNTLYIDFKGWTRAIRKSNPSPLLSTTTFSRSLSLQWSAAAFGT